jgi:hypothetical protein
MISNIGMAYADFMAWCGTDVYVCELMILMRSQDYTDNTH